MTSSRYVGRRRIFMTSHLSRAKPPPHLMDRLWIGPSYLDAHTTHRKPKKRLGGVTPATDERVVRRMRKRRRRSLLTRTKGRTRRRTRRRQHGI